MGFYERLPSPDLNIIMDHLFLRLFLHLWRASPIRYHLFFRLIFLPQRAIPIPYYQLKRASWGYSSPFSWVQGACFSPVPSSDVPFIHTYSLPLVRSPRHCGQWEPHYKRVRTCFTRWTTKSGGRLSQSHLGKPTPTERKLFNSTHASGTLRSGLRAQKLRGTAVSFACFLKFRVRRYRCWNKESSTQGPSKDGMGRLPRVWILNQINLYPSHGTKLL